MPTTELKGNKDRIGQALEDHGAFFAFSNEQFEEKAFKCVEYISLGAGLICPKGRHKQLAWAIKKARQDNIKDDLAAHTKKEIIIRELKNHEAQFSYDITDTADALKGYGITEAEIQAEMGAYLDYCDEHDLF